MFICSCFCILFSRRNCDKKYQTHSIMIRLMPNDFLACNIFVWCFKRL